MVPSISQHQRSKSLNSPRRMRQVHFKELDDCLSNLSISDGPKDLPPRPNRANDQSDEASGSGLDDRDDREDCAAINKEKRLRIEGQEDVRAPPGATAAMPPTLSRLKTGHHLIDRSGSPHFFPRPSLSCSDIGTDPLSPGAALARTSCSTPSTTPTLSMSPLSGSSQRESSAGSPVDPDRGLAAGAAESTGSGHGSGHGSASGGGGGGGGRQLRPVRKASLFERRGRRSPGQLSLKRSRSVHNSTWTGKREEVLGAEPGTPKLSKCDTL